jgi:hypothetical protein
MSRIILSRYASGQERVVVGWDHMALPAGCFYQEFGEEPADDDYSDDFEEMLREGGFLRGIPYDQFRATVPDDLQPLITDHVMELLYDHSVDPDSGYGKGPIDLSR